MPKTKRGRLSEEERAERRRADREFAREAIARLQGWRAWLEVRRHFRCYSVVNQVLIGSAAPGGDTGGGLPGVAEAGLCGKEGRARDPHLGAGRALARGRLRSGSARGGDPDERPRMFFKLGRGVRSDAGRAAAPPARPANLDPPIEEVEGNELAPALARLIAPAREIGSRVQFKALGGERLVASDAARRPSARRDRKLRDGLVPKAIERVLDDSGGPMRARELAVAMQKLRRGIKAVGPHHCPCLVIDPDLSEVLGIA